MKAKYENILRAIYGNIWAITPERLAAILDVVELRATSAVVQEEAIPEVPQPERIGSIAVLPLVGLIAQRMDLMTAASGGVSTERFGSQFQDAMSSKSVKAVVFDVDSGGGSVYGVSELAQTIYQARGQKPIVAIANSHANSAAYHIATAADRLYVTPGGEVGSIGIINLHTDASQADHEAGLNRTITKSSKYKAEVNPFEPLGEEAKAEIQRRVDEYHDQFVADVARQRGVSVEAVDTKFGEGRAYGAAEAVKRGMADGVATLAEVVNDLKRSIGSRDRREKRLRLSGR